MRKKSKHNTNESHQITKRAKDEIEKNYKTSTKQLTKWQRAHTYQ